MYKLIITYKNKKATLPNMYYTRKEAEYAKKVAEEINTFKGNKFKIVKV